MPRHNVQFQKNLVNRLRQNFKNDDLGPKMPNFPNFTNSKNFQSARYFCV